MPPVLRTQPGGQAPLVSAGRTVAVFLLAGLVALALATIGVLLIVRHVTEGEAIREAKELTRLAAISAVQPDLSDALLAGEPRAIAHLDASVRRRILRPPVVRVKLWTPSGRIVYSDEPKLVGQHYALRPAERSAIRHRIVAAEVSDATEPENRFERGLGKLLEVYLPIQTPSGRLLLYEEYLRFSAVTANARRQWDVLLPAIAGALILLELVQVPLAWSLARRLRERQREREALLRRAIDSSELERTRIAQSLHEGVVQELAGLSWTLTAAKTRAEAGETATLADQLHAVSAGIRQAIRQLRSTLIDLHPPSLQRSGLAAAVSDLAAPLEARGAQVEIRVPPDVRFPPRVEALVFRVAQEGARNAAQHAGAEHVRIEVSGSNGVARVEVDDDGRGFDPGDLAQRREEGHVGITLLSDLATAAGGRLDVRSSNGAGTRITLEVPVE
jgi:two-component system, NarL family, sensor kinase